MHEEAERVAATLRETGYAAHVETFESRGASEPWLAGYAALSAAAAVLLYPFPLATALLGVVALVLHARESDGRPLVSRASCTGSNVVAMARHAPEPKLVVLAPLLDRPATEPRRPLLAGLQTLMVAIPAAGAVAWIAEAEAELPPRVMAAGLGAALAVVGLALALYRPPGDPGDRTAAGLLLDLAPLVADDDVWLIGTGAPDAVRALLDEHQRELAGSVWLNLAPNSADGVVAVSEEGAWRERRGDRWLLDTAEEAGAFVRPYRYSTSVTPLLARRRRALTLLVRGDDALHTVVATIAAATASSR